MLVQQNKHFRAFQVFLAFFHSNFPDPCRTVPGQLRATRHWTDKARSPPRQLHPRDERCQNYWGSKRALWQDYFWDRRSWVPWYPNGRATELRSSADVHGRTTLHRLSGEKMWINFMRKKNGFQDGLVLDFAIPEDIRQRNQDFRATTCMVAFIILTF